MQRSPRLVVRADAGPAVGGGHVMRCLALAQQAILDGAAATFIVPSDANAFRARLESNAIEVVNADDIDRVATLMREKQADVAVLDGYRFGNESVDALRSAGARTLVVDDDLRYAEANAHLVLNQNVGARANDYARAKAKLLLGARFCMLRRDLVESAHARQRSTTAGLRNEVERVLVLCGAADPTNATQTCIAALDACSGRLDVRVVVGPANRCAQEIADAARASKHRIAIEENVVDMSELYAWADVAVSAAGSTSWELCFFGVPFLAMPLSPDQSVVTRGLLENDAAIVVTCDAASIANALEALRRDLDRRRALSANGRKLIDGDGAARVWQALIEAPLRLRLARDDDETLTLDWANDPETRAMSFSSAPITRDDHARWFARRIDPTLADAHMLLLAHDADDAPVGQVRFDRVEGTNDEDTIGIVVAPAARGRGVGKRLLAAGLRQARARRRTRRAHAHVKPENAASLALFRAVGFHEVKRDDAVHLLCDLQTGSPT